MWQEEPPKGTQTHLDDLCKHISGHCPTERQLLESTTLFPPQSLWAGCSLYLGVTRILFTWLAPYHPSCLT